MTSRAHDYRSAGARSHAYASMPSVSAAQFDLGRVFVSQAVSDTLSMAAIGGLLRRHARGDWGRPPLTTREQNVQNAIRSSGRVSSGYVHQHFPVWIVTTYDRQPATTILFPEDY